MSNIKQGVTYAQITKPKYFALPQTGDDSCINPSPTLLPPLQHSQQSNDIQELKTMIKKLPEQMGTLLNLLTTVLAKPQQGQNSFSSPSGTPTASYNIETNSNCFCIHMTQTTAHLRNTSLGKAISAFPDTPPTTQTTRPELLEAGPPLSLKAPSSTTHSTPIVTIFYKQLMRRLKTAGALTISAVYLPSRHSKQE
jgi:hypothetical protein